MPFGRGLVRRGLPGRRVLVRQVGDGGIAGAIEGVRCHGAGKLDRLREEVGEVDWARVTTYGDSCPDLAVPEFAGSPVAVHPDRALPAVAEQQDLPVLRLG